MCYLEHITPTGACRLCLVEIEGYPKPMASCVTYAIDGMNVFTDTELVKKKETGQWSLYLSSTHLIVLCVTKQENVCYRILPMLLESMKST